MAVTRMEQSVLKKQIKKNIPGIACCMKGIQFDENITILVFSTLNNDHLKFNRIVQLKQIYLSRNESANFKI